ncbi:fumarylacetoacetate hydrolase family protein [Paenibacillus filicis]|uniref:Fumarylacetoacetate hydrolase family protein n=1 Tax=Paenibacillus filicis TaxID=669464 RepID=A0ABU9DIS7_9BACL
MKLATVKLGSSEEAAIVTRQGVVALRTLNQALDMSWSTDLMSLLVLGELDRLSAWYRDEGEERLLGLEALPLRDAVYGPLYRNPRKIWGIGANYSEKAGEMKVTPPDAEPICFMKPDTSLIGPGDLIRLPQGAGRITAEAELGLVIGKACKSISPEEARDVVAGLVPTLDMTAQDIHARNPRFLGRSKCFDTFFSFGPHLVTLDEVEELEALKVQTALNGQVTHEGTVSSMIYNPWFIVSYFSQMMTLLPGDIIMTGTPGSIDIHEGDEAECRISGFDGLINPVQLEIP